FELLKRLGIETVRDLLFHFPRTYEDLSDVRPIAQLDSTSVQTVHGEIVEMEGRETNKGVPIVSIVLSDGGKDCLEGIWFHQPYISNRFRFGQRVAVTGKPRWYRGHWQMNNPRIRALDAEETDTPKVLPIYPLTEDLHAEQLRPVIRRAVEQFGHHLHEILPEALQRQRKLSEIQAALRDVHFPDTIAA